MNTKRKLPTDALPAETWAYCRYSSDKQNDRSIEQQISAIETRCAELGLPKPTPRRIYADRAKSGKSIRGRGELARMLAEAQDDRRPVRRTLVLWDVDRLGRNLFESIGIAGRLYQDLRFRIVTCERLDSNDDRFKADLVRAAESADYFLTRLSRNVKRGLEDARRKGHWLGKCPIGFKRDRERKTIVPDPVQLRWITFAFEQAFALRGHVADVLRRLRQQPTGMAWRKRTLIRALRAERYVDAGAVSREVFDAVQRFTAERGRRFNRDAKGRLRDGAGSGRSLFLGLFECASCGSPIVTTKRDLLDRRLGCRKHNAEGSCANGVTIREQLLFEELTSELQQSLLDSRAVDYLTQAVSERVQAAMRRAEGQTEELEQAIAERERRTQRLLRQAEESDEPIPELGSRLRELRAETQALRARLHEDPRPVPVTVLRSSVESYLPGLIDLLRRKPEETRAVLPDLIKRGLMFSEGRGRCRFEFELAPLGALTSLAPSGPYPSSRATPSPASSC